MTQENEPDIFRAIKPGAILENIEFHKGSCRPDFENTDITQNTRVSYPIHHIENHFKGCVADQPENIFFLTCDAFGVLPPIAKLTKAQAMYYFISGYTAKIAGTEEGILEPQATFSACFGAPFLPLHPTEYAQLLGQKIENNEVNIWLVNTGWSGGSYGDSDRISLKYTRALITSALDGTLNQQSFENFDVFNLSIPMHCPNVPSEILNPQTAWKNKEEFNETRNRLSKMFVANFDKFAEKASAEVVEAAPNNSLVLA